MIFRPEEVDAFEELFKQVKPKIEKQNGCNGVTLLRDINDSRIYFTYSNWDGDESLQEYRTSALFTETWIKTKALFDGKPEAWSVEGLVD